MRDGDADDELPPVIGERYIDVLAERAIALLDDYAPEPRRKPYKRRARRARQCVAKDAGGGCGKI